MSQKALLPIVVSVSGSVMAATCKDLNAPTPIVSTPCGKIMLMISVIFPVAKPNIPTTVVPFIMNLGGVLYS